MADGRDTIVALSSGRPPAGIAVLRLSGPQAITAAEAIAGPMPPPRIAALRTFNNPADRRPIDQGMLLYFPGPRSVTGENVVEFQCHGGRAVVDALLSAALGQAGVRLAEAGEFTRRALANGRIDLTEAEGLADLLAAETEAQRRAAVVVAEGGLRRQLEGWRSRLLELSARAEVAIDYGDEDDGAAIDDDIHTDLAALRREISELLARPSVEPLRDGIRVVIAGPPNVGKSSLINALTSTDRAIVTPISGTTRDSIEVPLAIDGLPFVLIDTAGLRDSDDPVETLGVARAARELERADIIVALGDVGSHHASSILVRSKADLPVSDTEQPGLPVSSVTGEGIAKLLALLVSEAKGILPVDDGVALNRRQAGLLNELADVLGCAAVERDPVLLGEELRHSRTIIDRITGAAGVEEMLDALFGRFCLGK